LGQDGADCSLGWSEEEAGARLRRGGMAGRGKDATDALMLGGCSGYSQGAVEPGGEVGRKEMTRRRGERVRKGWISGKETCAVQDLWRG
jgi:hypothetical protein